MTTKRITKYPRTWQHKETKQKVKVMPWWETVKDGEIEEVDELGQMVASAAGKPCKFGVLVQVGFLINNEHGVWFGMGPKAVEFFEDLGATVGE